MPARAIGCLAMHPGHRRPSTSTMCAPQRLHHAAVASLGVAQSSVVPIAAEVPVEAAYVYLEMICRMKELQIAFGGVVVPH